MANAVHQNNPSINSIFFPSFTGGGAERVGVLLANSLVERGGVVHVVVHRDEGPWRKYLDPRVAVIELGDCRYRWLIFKVVNYLRRHNPETMISIMNWFNVLASMAAVLSGWRGRLIVSEHISLEGTTAAYGFWRSWVLRVLMRLLYRRAYRVVAVSDQLARDLVVQLKLPEGKVVSIPNPVPVEDLRQSAMAPVSHRYFSEGVPIIIAVGRLQPQKDYPTMLRAVADLRKRRDVRLIILGEGQVRSELETLVKSLGLSEVVDLPGFVSSPWPWMARANTLVLTSLEEGWPMVLTEALALGIPIVATDCPTGPREILDNGKFGKLVPVGDVSAISTALEATLNDPPDLAALRARADEWSPRAALDAYLS